MALAMSENTNRGGPPTSEVSIRISSSRVTWMGACTPAQAATLSAQGPAALTTTSVEISPCAVRTPAIFPLSTLNPSTGVRGSSCPPRSRKRPA